MAQKKRKSHSGASRPQWKDPSEKTPDKRKRLNPLARNLILIAAVLIALEELLFRNGMIAEPVANVMALVALGCALGAAAVQFELFGKIGNRLD